MPSPHPPPPSSGSDDPDDGDHAMTAGRNKRVWYAVAQMTQTEAARKKARRETPAQSNKRLGRGIRKLVSLFDDLSKIVYEADNQSVYQEQQATDPEEAEAIFANMDEGDREFREREWERSAQAFELLIKLIPNFATYIAEMPPDKVHEYYDQLERGANNARGDDIKNLKEVTVDWIAELYPNAPRLTRTNRAGRGIQNDFTGRLICPITYDWDVEEIRTKLRDFNGHDDFNINNNFFCRCFYDGYSGDPNDFEKGFLKSNLLVKTYKYIFTSPSSAHNDDNSQENTDPRSSHVGDTSKPPARKCVASILGMKDEVTPRSIAYTCVMLHMSLNSASTWTIAHKGFCYRDLWEFIVDFFEDVPGPETAQRTKHLLNWWNRKVFPHTRSNTVAATAGFSRQALRDQRNARE